MPYHGFGYSKDLKKNIICTMEDVGKESSFHLFHRNNSSNESLFLQCSL